MVVGIILQPSREQVGTVPDPTDKEHCWLRSRMGEQLAVRPFMTLSISADVKATHNIGFTPQGAKLIYFSECIT